MTKTELYLKGEAVRRKLRGADDYAKNMAEYQSSNALKTFIETATETVFGALWARPGLDLKTRCLICVVSDAATGREEELAIHLRFALKQGWSEEELTEVLLHLLGYVGAPLTRGAMLVASRVFDEERTRASGKG